MQAMLVFFWDIFVRLLFVDAGDVKVDSFFGGLLYFFSYFLVLFILFLPLIRSRLLFLDRLLNLRSLVR